MKIDKPISFINNRAFRLLPCEHCNCDKWYNYGLEDWFACCNCRVTIHRLRAETLKRLKNEM